LLLLDELFDKVLVYDYLEVKSSSVVLTFATL
jgi:hypothetical protein